jgi:hypothetical protein
MIRHSNVEKLRRKAERFPCTGRTKDIVQLSQTLMELSKAFLKLIYSHEKETEGAGGTPSQSQQILPSTLSHIQDFLHRIRT